MRPSNIFFTLANQRSGTKLLGDCFNHGDMIQSLGEAFGDNYSLPNGFFDFVKSNENTLDSFLRGDTFYVLDQYLSFLSSFGSNIHIDLMYTNIMYFSPLWWTDPNKLPILEYIISRKIAIIHLTRDIKDTYISLVYAKHAGSYHNDLSVHDPDLKSVAKQVLIDEYINFRNSIVFFRKNIHNYFKNYSFYTQVCYEDLLSDDSLLTIKTRQQISRALANDVNEKNIQTSPCNLRPSLKSEYFKEIRMMLKGLE